MNYVVVSNSEIRGQANYILIKEYLKDFKGVLLVGDYDMDYLLYENLDFLFFDKKYFQDYKSKFNNKNITVKNLYLISLEEENLQISNENINVICGDTKLEDLEKISNLDNKLKIDYNLTNRDKTILYLLSNGMTNAEIGKKLYLSEKTIKNNLTRIYKTLGVKGKYEAISMYIKEEN